ncbi:SprB repeat-containing protein [Bacteroidota bacterium]
MNIRSRYLIIIFPIVVVLITYTASSENFADINKFSLKEQQQTHSSKDYRTDTVFYFYSPAQSTIYIESSGKINFSVKRTKSDPDTKKMKWLLNGKPIAEDVDQLEVNFGNLAKYTLECILFDESLYLYEDSVNYFSPEASVKWIIRNSAGDKTSPIDINLYGRDLIFKGINDGAIVVNVKGGKKPYYYYWFDGSSDKNRTKLAPGKYRLRVTDSEFRTLTSTTHIERKMNLNPQIISSKLINGWKLEIAGLENIGGLSYKWSNNSIADSINIIEEGTYWCIINFDSGNRIKLEINI